MGGRWATNELLYIYIQQAVGPWKHHRMMSAKGLWINCYPIRKAAGP